jgi:carbamoyltransferase
MKRLATIGRGQSLVHLYSSLIRCIGFKRFDEYKAMGLAPYGDPKRFRATFERGFALLAGGQYTLVSSPEWFEILYASGVWHKLERAAPFSRAHQDFAATLKETLERIVQHVLFHHVRATGVRNLCVAGGVGHNCTLNGKLLYFAELERTFFQPLAHDVGGALGAALAVSFARARPPPAAPLAHLFLGRDLPNRDRVRSILHAWRSFVRFTLVDDIADRAAKALADGAVIGWVQAAPNSARARSATAAF